MKKYLILSLAALAALVSCQKEGINNDPVSNGPVKFYASIADSDTKATIDYYSTGAKIYWELNDQITITDVATSEIGVYEVTDGAGTKKAILSFAGTGTEFDGAGTYTAVFGTAPSASQNYSSSNPTHTDIYMTASTPSSSDNICFTAQCGVLKLSLQSAGKSITKVEISDGTKLYALNMDAAVDISSEEVFYWSLPAGSYTRMYIYDNAGRLAVKSLSPALVITAGNLKPASTSTLSFDSISGAFTVNSSSKKVHFSKGNLKYTVGSPGTWSFYDNQYDCASGYDSGVISAFTWGYGSHSTVSDGTSYLSGHSIDGEDFSSSEDWGTAIGGTWRTLSKDEWTYVVNTRSETYKYAKAKLTSVGNVTGMILFPDGFSLPEGVTVNSANTTIAAFDLNSYDATAWGKLESAGCVFLPAAGRRSGSTVSSVGTRGYYYSSTAADPASTAYNLRFDEGGVYTGNSNPRNNGFSVRLVTE